jgi:hypothetical protein
MDKRRDRLTNRYIGRWKREIYRWTYSDRLTDRWTDTKVVQLGVLTKGQIDVQ